MLGGKFDSSDGFRNASVCKNKRGLRIGFRGDNRRNRKGQQTHYLEKFAWGDVTTYLVSIASQGSHKGSIIEESKIQRRLKKWDNQVIRLTAKLSNNTIVIF